MLDRVLNMPWILIMSEYDTVTEGYEYSGMPIKRTTLGPEKSVHFMEMSAL